MHVKSIVPLFLASFLVLLLLPMAAAGEAAAGADAGIDAGADAGTDAGTDDLVAVVGGAPVRFAELETMMAGDLARLEVERHRVLAAGLDLLVADRLLELEATRRGIGVEELLASSAQPEPVSDTEVDVFYARHRDRLQQPKEALAGQIRAHLENQRTAEARSRFIAELAARHGVEKRLAPPRFAIDTAAGPAKGGAGAKVTVVAFSDFQCPACARFLPVLDRLEERYGDRVQVAFKQFPLHSIHPQAQKAAEAALCAGAQDEFWTMHDALFANQKDLDAASLSARAREIGLDGERFDACLDSGEMAPRVAADQEEGQRIGVAGTPTLFVNGRPVAFAGGVDPLETLAAVIDEELESAVR